MSSGLPSLFSSLGIIIMPLFLHDEYDLTPILLTSLSLSLPSRKACHLDSALDCPSVEQRHEHHSTVTLTWEATNAAG